MIPGFFTREKLLYSSFCRGNGGAERLSIPLAKGRGSREFPGTGMKCTEVAEPRAGLQAAAPYLFLSRHIREDKVKREKITQIESAWQPGSQSFSQPISLSLVILDEPVGSSEKNRVFFVLFHALQKGIFLPGMNFWHFLARGEGPEAGLVSLCAKCHPMAHPHL